MDKEKLIQALNQDTISKQPRSNKALGLIADIIYPSKEAASMIEIPGIGNLAEFTGMDGAHGLIDDMSYGTPLIRGGSLQTSTIDPRIADVAAIAPLPAAGMRKLIKMLKAK